MKVMISQPMNGRCEEDLKILEEFIKYYESEAISRKFRGTLSISVDQYDIDAIEHLIKAYKELEEENEKYIVQLTDGQYRKLVDNIRNDVNKEWKSLVKEKIEEYEEKAKRIAGTYQYADSGDDLENKKKQVIELRTKAEGLQDFLEGK